MLPLRGAICIVWEVERNQSPRSTNLWQSSRARQWRKTDEDGREELMTIVLLDNVRITKLVFLQVPTDIGESKARTRGLTPAQLCFASC